MAKEPKMKIGIGADTGDFEKGARKVKQEMKDLNKVSSDAFGSIGGLVGINTKKLAEFSSAIQGAGTKLQNMGTAGTNAFGAILKSIGPVAVGIAGLGIAGATVAFKELNSEAEVFKNTLEGMQMDLANTAFIQTFKVALDTALGQGKSVAQFQNDVKNAWQLFKSETISYFTTGAAWESLKFWDSSTEKIDAWSNAIDEAYAKGFAAKSLTERIFELERYIKNEAVTVAQFEAKIAEARERASDSSLSTAERLKAVDEIESHIESIRIRTVRWNKELAGLYKQRSDLAPDDQAAADLTLQKAIEASKSEEYINQLLRQRTRLRNQILGIQERENAAAAKAWEAEREKRKSDVIEADRKKYEEAQLRRLRTRLAENTDILTSVEPLIGRVQMKTELVQPKDSDLLNFKNSLYAKIGPFRLRFSMNSLDEIREGYQNITKEVEAMMQSMAEKTGEAFGELAGNLINGDKPWETFRNSALSALGDLAIAVGKLAIQTGIAAAGIDAVLKNPEQWYLAVAAGVALVALGSAVKTGLSNIANGNYSSSASVATSNSTSSFSNNYEQRDVYVNVEGTLRADGDQLVAVINNSNKKKYVTT